MYVVIPSRSSISRHSPNSIPLSNVIVLHAFMNLHFQPLKTYILKLTFTEAKRQMQEYGIIKQNVDGVLFSNHRQERDKTLRVSLNNGTLLLTKIMCHCQFVVDEHTLFLYNIMCECQVR